MGRIKAKIIEGFGAGKALMKITAENLRAAVDEVLTTQTYHDRAKEIGQSLRSAGGAAQAVNELLTFMQLH